MSGRITSYGEGGAKGKVGVRYQGKLKKYLIKQTKNTKNSRKIPFWKNARSRTRIGK